MENEIKCKEDLINKKVLFSTWKGTDTKIEGTVKMILTVSDSKGGYYCCPVDGFMAQTDSGDVHTYPISYIVKIL